MKTFNDDWLIASAPPEMLLGLLVFMSIAALILLLLAIEDGRYPTVTRAVSAVRNWVSITKRRIAAAGKCWREVRYVES